MNKRQRKKALKKRLNKHAVTLRDISIKCMIENLKKYDSEFALFAEALTSKPLRNPENV